MKTLLARLSLLPAVLGLFALPAALQAQKALVYCPPSDNAGCTRVVEQLSRIPTTGSSSGLLFPGGVDRAYDGTGEPSTINLATADLSGYAVFFVPSFANAPYALLRDAGVAGKLSSVLTGRIAVWSGTPDVGPASGKVAGKLELIQNLARWAAGSYTGSGGTGLAVLQDGSLDGGQPSATRYDWVAGISGFAVAADLAERAYSQVEKNSSNPAADAIINGLAYDNMAFSGLGEPTAPGLIGAWGRTGSGKTAKRGQIVLVTLARGGGGSPGGGGSGGSSGKTASSITVEPEAASVQAGATQTLTATVRDKQNNPLSGKTVSWSSTNGGALSAPTSVTNASGQATTSLTVGTTAGTSYTVTASVDGKSATSVLTVASGPATTIAKEGSDPSSAAVGSTHTLQAKVTDATGNPISGHTVSWSVASGGGSVSAAASTTNASGIASITWTLGTTPGSQSATATATGLSGSPLTYSATAVAGPVSASHSTLSTDTTSLPADGTSTATLTVQLKDQHGNNRTSGGANVVLNTTGGTLSAVTDNSNGTYTATLTAPSTIGSATVSGTVGGTALGNTVTINFTAGAPTNLAIESGNGATLQVGSAHTLEAKVTDTNGVAVSGHTVSWAVASGGGSLSASSSITNASGIASITWTLGSTAGAQSATATASGASGALSGSPLTFSVTSTAGAAAKLAFTEQPTNTGAGASISPAVKVTLQDAGGNTVTSATNSVTLALGTNPSSGTLTGTATVAAVNGVATFSDLSIDKLGTGYTLAASSGSLTGATSRFIISWWRQLPGEVSPIRLPERRSTSGSRRRTPPTTR